MYTMTRVNGRLYRGVIIPELSAACTRYKPRLLVQRQQIAAGLWSERARPKGARLIYIRGSAEEDAMGSHCGPIVSSLLLLALLHSQHFTAAHQQPSAAAKQQSAATQQPSAAAQHPSSAARQPSAAARQPTLAAQQPTLAAQQPSSTARQPSAAAQQPSATDQLAALLAPVVEAVVSRALASERLSGADAGQRALTELGRLEGRLDAAVHGLAELQVHLGRLEGRLAERDSCRPEPESRTEPQSKLEPESERQLEPQSEREPEPESRQESKPAPCEPEPEPEPACERRPAPLPAGPGPYREPAQRACAGSCLQLRDQGDSPQDGVYWFTGMPVPVLCDFSHDGGGWTLLLTVAARDGWNALSVLRRNERSPSLDSNYAILTYADGIRDLGNGSRFAYRIEAKAEQGRRRWGGIWLAPRSYSFVHESPSQTDVSRAAKFNNWDYKDTGVEKRMPWLNLGSGSAVLTTSASSTTQWFGTLVTHETYKGYNFSPWIHEQALHSGRVLYWIREEML